MNFLCYEYSIVGDSLKGIFCRSAKTCVPIFLENYLNGVKKISKFSEIVEITRLLIALVFCPKLLRSCTPCTIFILLSPALHFFPLFFNLLLLSDFVTLLFPCLFDCLPKAGKYWSIHLLCTTVGSRSLPLPRSPYLVLSFSSSIYIHRVLAKCFTQLIQRTTDVFALRWTNSSKIFEFDYRIVRVFIAIDTEVLYFLSSLIITITLLSRDCNLFP